MDNPINKKIIYLADLTHTVQVIASEFMPLSVACIASYLKAYSRYADEIDVELFKFPDDLISAISERQPFVLALSNYLWNSDLANQVARLAKQRYPDLTVIFGGPNFSEAPEDQKEWLAQRPWVDFYIHLEGEIAFNNLIDAILDNGGDAQAVKPMAIKSVYSVKDGVFCGSETEDRIKNFDNIPSPYVQGLMDKFFDTTLWPLVETNRGCPFSCAYCTEGLGYFNKVSKKQNEKVSEELTYIAKNHKKQKMMFFADSNFLMFKENLEICDTLAGLQKKYGWPTFIGSSTGKNRQEIVLEGARRVNGAIALSASVQHLDPVVLKNIKRDNISMDDIFNIAKQGEKIGITTYTEVICCLPGDTLEKYRETLKELIVSGLNIIRTHTLLLLEGSEFCTREARAKFGFQTRYRATTKSFGYYDFDGNSFPALECEEVVVGTHTLAFEDYLECRRLQVTIQVFFNDDLFKELHDVLKAFRIPVWDWLMRIHNGGAGYNEGTKALYDSYMNDAKGELFESPEQIRADFEKDPDQYLSGRKGSNVTFKHKALLFDRYVNDVLEAGYRCARELLRETGGDRQQGLLDFLDEVKTVSLLRKGDIFNWRSDVTHALRFNPEILEGGGLSSNDMKLLDNSISVTVEHSDDQKKLLSHYFENHERDNIIELAWLLNRVPAGKLYKKLVV